MLNVLARLPFLNAGYGREEDSWAQALNAQSISETGIYEVSRLPGHPLYELLLAFLWPIHHSYFFFNLLSTLASAFAVLFFYRICKKIKIKQALPLALTLGFIPVFFITGVYTIDYNFALLFIIVSFYSLLKEKIIWAGILLGIATGFRISSLGFIIPWILFYPNKKDWAFLLKLGISASITSIIAFLPPLLTYGPSFLDFHKPPYSSWSKIIFKLSFGVWGMALFFYLGGIGFYQLFRKKVKTILPNPKLNHFNWGLIVILTMQLFVFFRLPFKSEFLIPALPFILIFLGINLSSKQLKWLPIAALTSCFLFGFDYYNPFRGSPPSSLATQFSAGGKQIYFDPLQGPSIIDYRKRINKMQFVSQVLDWSETRDKKTYLISGWYWPQIELRKSQNTKVKTDYYSTKEEINTALENEYSIFYLPEINESNAQIEGHYLADTLGTLLIP